MSASFCGTVAARRANVSSAVLGLSSTISSAASRPWNRSASQSSTGAFSPSERRATPQILSGRPSAVFTAVSRTAASASKEST